MRTTLVYASSCCANCKRWRCQMPIRIQAFLACGGRLRSELTPLGANVSNYKVRVRGIAQIVTKRGRHRCELFQKGRGSFYARSDRMVAHRDDACHVQSQGSVAGTATKSFGSRHDPDHRYNGDSDNKRRRTRCGTTHQRRAEKSARPGRWKQWHVPSTTTSNLEKVEQRSWPLIL